MKNEKVYLNREKIEMNIEFDSKDIETNDLIDLDKTIDLTKDIKKISKKNKEKSDVK